MFGTKLKASDRDAKLAALDRSQAIIEFAMDGTILDANENFLETMGYEHSEVVGRHHSIFVEPSERDSQAYKDFWGSLNRGEFKQAEFKRLTKDGRAIWIQATYNPLIGRDGKPYKVIKFATDVTERKLREADVAGQFDAIGRSQAVIQFNLDGTIITANENFLNAMGYELDEIVGQHHSMFVDPAERDSPDYKAFWESLKSGEFRTAEYRRIAKGGREIWIQASYNPIFDMSGKPFKVVKFATDTTAQVQARMKAESAQKTIAESLAMAEQAISNANEQSAAAAAASGQTSSTVQAVAAGAEQLNASVNEISESMVKSKGETDVAYERVQAADHDTQKLASTAQEMSGIVELIQNIAAQINLLALNATIESARAGEAGRGFAVVANEVKNLAKQAADATDRISGEIAGIQDVSRQVVEGLDTIKTSISSVRDYVISTSSAVEEQTAVAREMSSNMQSASESVEAITGSIRSIAEATKTADASTKQVREAARAVGQARPI